ncbi:MAG: hypothetical protein PWP07_236 [Epulopiscium sp.]|uniref:Uncharacterized protein n=1 Tax=Defluviitalea raffinosedens TaxID=1450156 RepID=A0A7C8LFL5_9FIRM|nr:hypothetical protein [Defluviitalea raffinosedens]MBZ4667674.1 hypothetical protein [Defluviitaleaceae bacterium]MDK2787011.1 hypothetical protein [Candidatus Epulonipiscium sp.]KAE9630236.1 hypothetical protein GND95_12520 [Defluviitalea raffinosedens]MBM7686039.1 hypothetical protein [Defluviitalea raffinosedens]HHW67714.1 hypothetical protein [Candidatus Epulonipiscium sp.]
MTEHREIYKRLLYQLLEEILLLIIVLFIFVGIYVPVRSISKQITKSQENTIRITAPDGMPLYINGEKSSSSIDLILENGEYKTKDTKQPVKIKKRPDGSYDIEIKTQP